MTGHRPSPARGEELDCAEVEALLPLVADGALEPADDPALFAHLARCPDCQASLAAYDLVDLALARSRVEDGMVADQRLHWRRLGWGAAAAALLAMLGLGAGLRQMTQGEDPLASLPPAPQVEVVHVERDEEGGALLLIRRDGRLIVVPADDAPRREDRDLAPGPDGALPVTSAQRRLRR